MNTSQVGIFGRWTRVAAIACIAAIGFAGAASAADGSKGKKVLMLQSFAAHPYVAAIIKSFRERATALGMDVTILAAGLDAALQARQMDDGLARKYDLIALAPISEQGIIPSLARAKQAGVPVVLVNNPAKVGAEDYFLTFVGQDQTEQGRQSARAMLAALKASGRSGKVAKVALITGALSQGIGPRRVDGIKEVFAQHKNEVNVVATEDGKWDTATSERIAGQLFARFAASGGLDLVYGMADNQAVAAIKAATAAGIDVGVAPNKLAVVGATCLKEGIQAVRDGKMYATLAQIPTTLGVLAADTIDGYFNGKKPPKFTYMPVDIITKANVEQWAGPCTY
jgi:ribose transport system substrate-binding protein